MSFERLVHTMEDGTTPRCQSRLKEDVVGIGRRQCTARAVVNEVFCKRHASKLKIATADTYETY